MADTKCSRGMIAVDKMGAKILFLNPATYETEVVLEDFPRTVRSHSEVALWLTTAFMDQFFQNVELLRPDWVPYRWYGIFT